MFINQLNWFKQNTHFKDTNVGSGEFSTVVGGKNVGHFDRFTIQKVINCSPTAMKYGTDTEHKPAR